MPTLQKSETLPTIGSNAILGWKEYPDIGFRRLNSALFLP